MLLFASVSSENLINRRFSTPYWERWQTDYFRDDLCVPVAATVLIAMQ
jgi:hypothetical protein